MSVRRLLTTLGVCLFGLLLATIFVLSLAQTARAETNYGFLNLYHVYTEPSPAIYGGEIITDTWALVAQGGTPAEETTHLTITYPGGTYTQTFDYPTTNATVVITFTAPITPGYYQILGKTWRASDGLGDYIPSWFYVNEGPRHHNATVADTTTIGHLIITESDLRIGEYVHLILGENAGQITQTTGISGSVAFSLPWGNEGIQILDSNWNPISLTLPTNGAWKYNPDYNDWLRTNPVITITAQSNWGNVFLETKNVWLPMRVQVSDNGYITTNGAFVATTGAFKPLPGWANIVDESPLWKLYVANDSWFVKDSILLFIPLIRR